MERRATLRSVGASGSPTRRKYANKTSGKTGKPGSRESSGKTWKPSSRESTDNGKPCSREVTDNGQGRSGSRSAQELIAQSAEPFDEIDSSDIGPLMERIGNARIVLMGGASHGTSEFYQMRQRITRELIQEKGFTIVAVEADWPDAEHVDEYVSGRFGKGGRTWKSFGRFPVWMWRNREVYTFIEWMRGNNHGIRDIDSQAGFYGLDLYSMYTSIAEVIRYLKGVDPALAEVAMEQYSCFSPFTPDGEDYGRAVTSKKYQSCESDALVMLSKLQQRRQGQPDGTQTGEDNAAFSAVQNARTVAGAEEYYRAMYYGSAESWNLRDRHMFETLEALLEHRGPNSKAVVWAHNSHIGDVSATHSPDRGHISIGQLCRENYPDNTCLIGFGTHAGTVAASSSWGSMVEHIQIPPSHSNSYERLCHESGIGRFILPTRSNGHQELREKLSTPRLERSIGVVYRPEKELQNHYIKTVLAEQFDEFIWFDETHPVQALEDDSETFMPSHHPFYLAD